MALAQQSLGVNKPRSFAELGKAARAGDVEAAQLLEGIGKSQMARTQAGLDTAYEDFVRQRDYPREQLQFMSSILRGVPVAPYGVAEISGLQPNTASTWNWHSWSKSL